MADEPAPTVKNARDTSITLCISELFRLEFEFEFGIVHVVVCFRAHFNTLHTEGNSATLTNKDVVFTNQ